MLARLVWKSVVQRPLRYLLTGVSIIVGVAAVSAVFIFTDGLRATFDELAGNIESGYDIAVQPVLEFGDDFLAPSLPIELADRLEAVEGVAIVQPRVVGLGVIPVDADGEPTVASGGPNLGLHWGSRNPDQSLFLQEGRAPTSPREFALDADSFADGNYRIGDAYLVQVPSALEQGTRFTLVGTFTFGDPERNALLGARLVAFDEATAVELINQGTGYSDITLVVEPDADVATVIEQVRSIVDDRTEVRTREEVVAETQGNFGEVLTIFRTVLLVFAVIILFVSSFLIYNVFSITLGQRIRELGLLRAVGARGTQITQLMMGEALMLGVTATIIGLPSGLGVAWLLRAALQALGFPDESGLPLSPWTVFWAIMTGVAVTLLAAIWPSIQARRVSPMAALRDGANLTELTALRNVPAGVATAIGGLAALGAAFAFGGWAPRLGLPLLGALLIYVGTQLIDRGAARFVLFPTGVGLLIVVLVGSFSLGETFGLLGSGALVALLGANLLNPLLARPATRLLGNVPSTIILGLLGIVLGLGGLAALGLTIVVVATGVPTTISDAAADANLDVGRVLVAVPALIVGLLLIPLAYGLIRTSYGSLGLTGRVARANAARNPQRTATTAAALMIGLTLVTAVTIIGASIKASVRDALSSSITADWLLQGPSSGPSAVPFSTEAGKRIEALDEVESVVPFRIAFPAAWVTSTEGTLDAGDFQQFLPIVLQLLNADEDDIRPQELLDLRNRLGSDIEINDALAVDFDDLDAHVDPDFIARDESLIGPNAIYIVDDFADEKELEVGDTFSALFVDLRSEDLTVAGIYTNAFVLGPRVMTLDMWNRHFPADTDQFLTAVTADGVSPDAARAAITAVLEEDFPILEVQDKKEFAASQERQIDQTLATVNVLLGLSAVIAALGILVALALSVFERTREIGLFRAVGTTRQQTRWMIRWEGVIVAAFGGLAGVVLGVALGALATAKLPEILVTTTSIPWGTLIAYVVVAMVTGLAAAVFPAWIAGRMNVLDSIATE